MKILSLFDGMACGMLALLKAGIDVESYTAYEIDKYAIQTATYNFPQIDECGDVFLADFTQYKGIDLLIGGSPCTYWSIAQKNNRETTASGIGWELFSQYVRAVKDAKPKFFIYENNKSMSSAIRASITQTFGFEPICINSALVSAQNRQRLYWVGQRAADGTYCKVDVQQPQDKGILLKDVLDGVTDREKGRAIIGSAGRTTTREYFNKSQGNMAYEPVIYQVPHGFNGGGIKYGKSPTLTANGSWQNNNFICEPVGAAQRGRYTESGKRSYKCSGGTEQFFEKDCLVAEPVNITTDGKAHCLRATCYKDGIRNMVGNSVDKRTCVAEPVVECVSSRGVYRDTGSRSRKSEAGTEQRFEVRGEGKTNALTTVQKDNMIIEQVGVFPNNNGEVKNSLGNRIYSSSAKSVTLKANGGGGAKTGLYAVPVKVGEINGGGQGNRIYSVDGKSVSQTATSGGLGSNTGLYVIPVEYKNNIPIKAQSYTDGKTYTVYEVKNGLITIKDKKYPIKLPDGEYIIRKLTVSECKRLQTVPEWYEFPVSDTQAYKMLGNGWTVDVIAHILGYLKEEGKDDE